MNEYLSITEDDVKKILQNKDEYLNNIYKKMDTIHEDIDKTDDLMRMVSLRRSNLSDMPKGHSGHSDLSTVYEKYLAALEKRDSEYADFFATLIEEELSIQRVWLCFQALKEPYYGILNRLYVEHELYATVESESGVSRRAFEERRKMAIHMIIKLYESDCTEENLLLIRRQLEKEQSQKHRKQSHSMGTMEQITMDAWLIGGVLKNE